MAKSVASGFTISGLLDRNASTRSDYPVERIPVGEIADHPANAAYSMDDAGIAQLARSIKEEGLTDLPLVRKLDDGGWQMVSGHRRKAAYALLAEEDEKYAQIPCRVIRDITDEQSVMLLHAANYFVRSLTVSERAAASRALGVEVERMRAENPGLAGVRTEDIKAAIISEMCIRDRYSPAWLMTYSVCKNLMPKKASMFASMSCCTPFSSFAGLSSMARTEGLMLNSLMSPIGFPFAWRVMARFDYKGCQAGGSRCFLCSARI